MSKSTQNQPDPKEVKAQEAKAIQPIQPTQPLTTQEFVNQLDKTLKEEDQQQKQNQGLSKDADLEKTKQAKKEVSKEDIKMPTIGRAVHYFPNKADVFFTNEKVTQYPATVVSVTDDLVTMSVFTDDDRQPVVVRKDVPTKKKSEELKSKLDLPYWDWPEIK